MEQTVSEAELRTHFDTVMARRGASVPFDRFEQDNVVNDGNRIHLDIIEGEPGRPVVVFVPGTSVYGLTFGDFLSGLADTGINVVSFDPRGHGRSEGTRGSYTIPELVSDARAAIDYAIRRFSAPVFLCGSSQGGIVAFYTAATDARLAGAICHNASDLPDPSNVELSANKTLARVLRPILRTAAAIAPEKRFNVERYYNLLSRGDETIKARLKADPLSLKVISMKALGSLSTARLERPVEQIKTPILLLLGEEDRIFPLTHQQRLFDRLNCPKKLMTYEGIGHYLVTEHADLIIPDITAWIDETLAA